MKNIDQQLAKETAEMLIKETPDVEELREMLKDIHKRYFEIEKPNFNESNTNR